MMLFKIKNIVSPDLILKFTPNDLMLVEHKLNIISEILLNEISKYKPEESLDTIKSFNSFLRNNTISSISKYDYKIYSSKSCMDLDLLNDINKSHCKYERRRIKLITKAYNSKTKGKKYKECSIRNNMKNIGYSYFKSSKIDRKTDTIENKNQKIVFNNEFSKMIQQEYKFIFIDETSLNQNIISLKNWNKKYERQIATKEKKFKTLTAICSFSPNGFRYVELIETYVNSEIFTQYVRNLIEYIEYNDELLNAKLNGKLVLFFDGASVHKDIDLLNFISDCNIRVLFNSPYSCRYQPIENLFAIVKCKLTYYYCYSKKSRIKTFKSIFLSQPQMILKNLYCSSIRHMINDLSNFYQINEET